MLLAADDQEAVGRGLSFKEFRGVCLSGYKLTWFCHLSLSCHFSLPRARSCKVIVKFEVRKEGVNSEVLWGTQEDS